jgi:hypothetical protein
VPRETHVIKDKRVDVRLVKQHLAQHLPTVAVPDPHVPIKSRACDQPGGKQKLVGRGVKSSERYAYSCTNDLSNIKKQERQLQGRFVRQQGRVQVVVASAREDSLGNAADCTPLLEPS